MDPEQKPSMIHYTAPVRKKKVEENSTMVAQKKFVLGGKKGHWHKDMIENWKATK